MSDKPKPGTLHVKRVESQSGSTVYNRIEVEYLSNDHLPWYDPMHRLVISAQQDSERDSTRDGRLYAWTVAFKDIYEVDLAKAEAMRTVLLKVKRGLDKVEAMYGPVSDFGSYVLRVATVLGLDLTCDGTWMSPAEQIRDWEREFIARFEPKTED